jgi:hypothetical protein
MAVEVNGICCDEFLRRLRVWYEDRSCEGWGSWGFVESRFRVELPPSVSFSCTHFIFMVVSRSFCVTNFSLHSPSSSYSIQCSLSKSFNITSGGCIDLLESTPPEELWGRFLECRIVMPARWGTRSPSYFSECKFVAAEFRFFLVEFVYIHEYRIWTQGFVLMFLFGFGFTQDICLLMLLRWSGHRSQVKGSDTGKPRTTRALVIDSARFYVCKS